jgi:hypothetical protein
MADNANLTQYTAVELRAWDIGQPLLERGFIQRGFDRIILQTSKRTEGKLPER